jgi:hypothetical protein
MRASRQATASRQGRQASTLFFVFSFLLSPYLVVLVLLVPSEQVLLHQQLLHHCGVEAWQRLLEGIVEGQLGVGNRGGRPD